MTDAQVVAFPAPAHHVVGHDWVRDRPSASGNVLCCGILAPADLDGWGPFGEPVPCGCGQPCACR